MLIKEFFQVEKHGLFELCFCFVGQLQIRSQKRSTRFKTGIDADPNKPLLMTVIEKANE